MQKRKSSLSEGLCIRWFRLLWSINNASACRGDEGAQEYDSWIRDYPLDIPCTSLHQQSFCLQMYWRCKQVRFFECADILRVVSTYSEIQTVSLLADISDVLMRMTFRARDFPEHDFNCLEISPVFLLAGVPAIMTGGIDESGNILSAIPCTSMYQKYFCLQEYWRLRKVRFLECADILRAVGTYSEIQKVFLLAGMPDVLMRMTPGIRDCLQGYSSYS